MKNILILLIGLCLSASLAALTRITCIGAGITYGATLSDPKRQSFPGQLQIMLGSNYLVSNFGVSGTALLRHGDRPYQCTSAYQMALKSNPDIVFIDLGGNDSKATNRPFFREFVDNYHTLINTLRSLPSHPRIVLLLALPSFVKDSVGIYDPVIVNQINPRIRQVAYDENLEVLDMYSPLIDHEELMPDKIHPDLEGSALLAKKLYAIIMQPRDTLFNIFKAFNTPYQLASFYGYSCASFLLNGRECKVVKPKWSAKGHPWIWRSRFWGHEPQTDIALLERGFHVVYSDVAELLGNEEAVTRWNNFYRLLRDKGLGKKAVLEGMSRGGIYMYNWAAANPTQVACTYADNALLDLQYWPDSTILKRDFNLVLC